MLERQVVLVQLTQVEKLLDLDFSALEIKEYIDVTQIEAKSLKSFDKVKQKIKKFNDRAVKSETLLGVYSQMLDKAIDFTRNTNGKTILCFDVEVLETNHRHILEIGWSMYRTGKCVDGGPDDIITRHFIVEENLKRKNGRYVPDNKFHFSFGTSVICSLTNIINDFIADLKNADCIIGHSVDSDFKFLQQFLHFVNLDDFNLTVKQKRNSRQRTIKSKDHEIQNACQQQSMRIASNTIGDLTLKLKKLPLTDKKDDLLITVKKFDTMYMTSFVLKEVFNHCSLKKALGLFESTRAEHFVFHNAGNDAHATMKLFLALVYESDRLVS